MCVRTISILAIFLMLVSITQSIYAEEPIAGGDVTSRDWSWFGDVMLRAEHVGGLPNNREDLQRFRARMRARLRYNPIPELEFGAAIKLTDGSDSNRDNRRNNDNERSDSVSPDQFYLRWHMRESTDLLAGKASFPLELSPLVWDQDLRPIGLSLAHTIAIGDFNQLHLLGGYFAGDHLYDDQSRITAVQASFRWHEGAPQRFGVLLSFLHFTDLEQLTQQGLARTNRRIGSDLISDYQLLDLQLVGGLTLGEWPLEARLDRVRNLGADDQRDGTRISLVLGDSRRPQSFEFGLAYQRVQRDAVMAAFNADDWWFHSADRGVMPWLSYGIDSVWSVRLAGFHELRDGLNEHTDRLLLDVFARW